MSARTAGSATARRRRSCGSRTPAAAARTRRRAPRSASIAATACARGTRYSDWISSPLLGVKPMRKCGRRSDHGPGTPSCGVQFAGSRPRIGWRSTVAGRAPKSSSRAARRDAALDPHLVDGLAPAREDADAVAARRDLVEVLGQRLPGQALEDALAHLVGRLDVERHPRHHAERAEADDQAVEVRRRRARTRDAARRRTSRARAPRPPSRGCRCASPEPCVAVATAPATEMCGSEARLCSASPSRLRARRRARRSVRPARERDRARRRGRRRRRRAAPSSDDQLVGVGDRVERVARAEHAHGAAPARPAPAAPRASPAGAAPRAVGEVAGPVALHGARA